MLHASLSLSHSSLVTASSQHANRNVYYQHPKHPPYRYPYQATMTAPHASSISPRYSPYDHTSIIQIDITNLTPLISDLVTNINNPTGLFLDGNDLYISVYGDNKIVKFSSTILRTEEYSSGSQKLKIFPNPSTEFIQVSNLTTNKNYKIYSVLGTEIKSGNISNNDIIDIKNLTNETYFLKLENGNSIKFLKK